MQPNNWKFRIALAVSLFLLMFPAVLAAQGNSSEGTAATTRSSSEITSDQKLIGLSPDAWQVARIIRIEPLIIELSKLTTIRNGTAKKDPSFEELLLRQQISETILAASLDVDSVLNKIDYEREQVTELQTLMLSQRERASGNTNLAILAIGTGLGVISSTLSLTNGTSKVGDAVGIGAGGLSALLWLRSYRQQRSGKRPMWTLPNMLAPILGETEPLGSYYPDVIWTYLNSVPSEGKVRSSRKNQLLEEWLAANRIASSHAPQSKQKIALLISTDAADKNIHLDTLSERMAMLADVRDRVALMKADLSNILQSLRIK